jgi:hypothetical protein
VSGVDLYDVDIWPLTKGDEISSAHAEQLRRHMWLIEHPCAGNLDTTELYGKWTGDGTAFGYVEYNKNNWKGWNPGTTYHPGFPKVKYRWGSGEGQVDIFVFITKAKGDKLDLNPPVIGGRLNTNYWLLGTDPNKYSHWNFGAGRPDIGAEARWIISQHGYDPPPDGVGWIYGRWEAWRELPIHTNPFEQVPHIKTSLGDSAQHNPVEQKREQITKTIRPLLERSFQNGYVGIIPNHTWWVHHDDREKISEYVLVSGEPSGSIQVGPSYVDSKMNQAFLDRAQHLIERNYQYLIPADQDFKNSWQYWCTFGIELDEDHDDGCPNPHRNYAGFSGSSPFYQGTYTTGRSYSIGNVVYWNNYWWRCIMDLSYSTPSTAPGEPGGSDYWDKPLHQPDYISTDPIYVQFSDYLWHCNSSAFEKVLEIIGKCDWYWDEDAPAVPWWLYQKYYYYMTLHLSDPDAGHAETAQKRYPLPRGCWRRVWRHTMCWDHDRDKGQKARLGKIIDIDGQKVSMMWPGELGNPPGYDLQLLSFGEIGGVHYDYTQFKHIITQAQWDNIDRTTYETWTFEQYYTVVDVEELFKAAYRNNTEVESLIKERHDPTVTDWRDDGIEIKEYPVYEMKADLLNDIREALLQLKILRQYCNISAQTYKSTAILYDYPTSLAAYDAGKAHCDAEIEVSTGNDFMDVGYIGMVVYDAGSNTYDTVGIVSNDYQTTKHWVEVVITKGAGECFQAKEVGTLLLDIKVWWSQGDPGDACTIGAGSFTYKPPSDGVVRRVYLGEVPGDCEWVYDGTGDDPEDWELKCTFRIEPVDPWPPDAYFNFSGTSKDWYRGAGVTVKTGESQALAWELDFDGFDISVFEEDPTNCIEIEV